MVFRASTSMDALVNVTPGSTSAAKSFLSPPTTIKLEQKNFKSWQQLALHIIGANDLEDHLHSEKIPPRFSTTTEETARTESAQYKKRKLKDHALMTWLLSTTGDTFINKIYDCKYAYQVWDKIQDHLKQTSKMQIKQLKGKLKLIKINGLTATEYLQKIQQVVDFLAALGHVISRENHIEVITEGLNEEYAMYLSYVMTKSDDSPILYQVESLFLGHEQMLE
ncbi:hypothetical protein PIB30_118156 [Stylosanthes scabra]|uniref:Uncharacterized protein n=1 Tax=Stylosanthes scabra TaxID=79078 RepID=A0ABU6T236_9FABA|nr:hypothetical protein [Stylosanthes scabra]